MSKVRDYFLLTYSVENQSDKDLSDKVRNAIADINNSSLPSINKQAAAKIIDWKKLDNVETTIKGFISLESSDYSNFADDAENVIRNLFHSVLKSNNAKNYATTIHCAMLTQNSGETFTFYVVCS
ncbi:hypothetical protein [Pectobacterium polaris]|uniref:hypothetical protein n=1 Tax=Pectobacterium polaris TaxID=2042057 RepID=UPI001CF5D05B|nr:hypothetical protein [Pectobacterium polaris]MCA6954667.1 hypothetical protein [Pectobacterium polaris]